MPQTFKPTFTVKQTVTNSSAGFMQVQSLLCFVLTGILSLTISLFCSGFSMNWKKKKRTFFFFLITIYLLLIQFFQFLAVDWKIIWFKLYNTWAFDICSYVRFWRIRSSVICVISTLILCSKKKKCFLKINK